MSLIVSDISQAVQTQIRPLIKLMSDKEVNCHVVIQGQQLEKITLNTSHVGPTFDSCSLNLTLYLHKENHLISYRMPMVVDGELDHEELGKKLYDSLLKYPTLEEPQEACRLKVEPISEALVDDSLLEMDSADCINYFVSRFVVDGPKKLLFEAQLMRGIIFNGYVGTASALQLRANSFYQIHTRLRSPKCHLSYHRCGPSLKDLNLASVRNQLKPFWKSKKTEMDQLPNTVLLGEQAVFQLLQATIQKGSVRAPWIETSSCQGMPLKCPGLIVKERPDHPVALKIFNHYQVYKHVPGEVATDLEILLDGKEAPFSKYVYINNFSGVSMNQEEFEAVSHGTLLQISAKSGSKIINDYIQIKINYESFQEQINLGSKHLVQRIDERRHIGKSFIFPEFMFLENTDMTHIKVEALL